MGDPSISSDRQLFRLWEYVKGCRRHYATGSLFLLLTNASALLIPWLLKLAVDSLGRGAANGRAATGYAVLIIVSAVVHGLTRVFSRTFILNAARTVEFRIREDLFRVLLKQDKGFFSSERTGDIISRFSNDLTNIRMLCGFGVMNIINTFIMYGAAIILMSRLHPLLTICSVLPFPAMILLVRMISRKMFGLSLKAQEELAGISNLAEESAVSMPLIRTYRRENVFSGVFAEASTRYLRSSLAVARMRGLVIPIMAMATGAGMLIVLFAGGRLVISGAMSLGDFVAFGGYLAMLVWPTAVLGWIVNLMQRGAASTSRVCHILDAEPIVRDADEAIEISSLERGITLSDVWLMLGERPVLKGISMEIRRGWRVGITGEVGSGKSLLLELMMRVREPSRGRILIDGKELERISLQSLRRLMGYVPQEPFLFSRSIRENLQFGDAGRGGDPPEDSLARSGMTDDIESFGSGIDTEVGERGITLSGGQKQRIALARALAADPEVLLLDDPLSSVDADRESEILGHLESWYGSRTVIVVSQRVSALHGCDRVFVMGDGEIVEEGAPSELLAAGGAYASMYRLQQMSRESGF